MPTCFSKTAIKVIVPYLQPLVHYAFSNGILRNHCKIAKRIPFHKRGNTDDRNTYSINLFQSYPVSLKYVKNCFIRDSLNFLPNIT